MKSIHILCDSQHGQTRRIARRMGKVLIQEGAQVRMFPAAAYAEKQSFQEGVAGCLVA